MFDMTKPYSVVSRSVEAAAKALGGRIDILVNKAGWGLVGAVEENLGEGGARRVRRQFLGSAQSHSRRASDHARVRAIYSPPLRLAASPVSRGSAYSAAKAAVDVMNEALAQEIAPFGIKGTDRIPASMTIIDAVAALNWESREKEAMRRREWRSRELVRRS